MSIYGTYIQEVYNKNIDIDECISMFENYLNEIESSYVLMEGLDLKEKGKAFLEKVKELARKFSEFISNVVTALMNKINIYKIKADKYLKEGRTKASTDFSYQKREVIVKNIDNCITTCDAMSDIIFKNVNKFMSTTNSYLSSDEYKDIMKDIESKSDDCDNKRKKYFQADTTVNKKENDDLTSELNMIASSSKSVINLIKEFKKKDVESHKIISAAVTLSKKYLI